VHCSSAISPSTSVVPPITNSPTVVHDVPDELEPEEGIEVDSDEEWEIDFERSMDALEELMSKCE